MRNLVWFIFGIIFSSSNITSIKRMVFRLDDERGKKNYWISYTIRLVFTGIGLFLALQMGIQPAIFMFLGIIICRWVFISLQLRLILS